MKKGLIIGGGIVLALMLAAFIIFPGIPTYIAAAKEYEHINEDSCVGGNCRHGGNESPCNPAWYSSLMDIR